MYGLNSPAHIAMKQLNALSSFFKVILTVLLLSNFSALAQKTNIFIVRVAEQNEAVLAANNISPGLSNEGDARAEALLKALKREKIQTIYIPAGKVAGQTVAPLSAKAKILARVYIDSVSAFIKKITRNFQGTNVLIVAQYKDIMPIISELGVTPPFAELTEDDYDLLFAITITENDSRELFVSNYGKKHHVTEIPQQYIIQKYYPSFVPPVNSH
jgi:2,3-bisphosphoglycerate-dependent phosphoglycerate mutase